MKIILALGNPGARYAATRHNIGWMVADRVASRLGITFQPGPGDYHEAVGEIGGRAVALVKPTTYMNNSGIAARQVLERRGVDPSDMLVIVDEIQLPPGRIKLKSAGSSAGHNGTESLIYQLQTEQFARLRCGVGNNFAFGGLVDYVLAPFNHDELEQVEEMIEAACTAVEIWVAEGTARAMNRVNVVAKAESSPGVSDTGAGQSSTQSAGGNAAGGERSEA